MTGPNLIGWSGCNYAADLPGFARIDRLQLGPSIEPLNIERGTGGSNPSPSSGESCELNFASPDIASPFSYRRQDSAAVSKSSIRCESALTGPHLGWASTP